MLFFLVCAPSCFFLSPSAGAFLRVGKRTSETNLTQELDAWGCLLCTFCAPFILSNSFSNLNPNSPRVYKTQTTWGGKKKPPTNREAGLGRKYLEIRSMRKWRWLPCKRLVIRGGINRLESEVWARAVFRDLKINVVFLLRNRPLWPPVFSHCPQVVILPFKPAQGLRA